jgi:hypothetical protein
MRAYAAEVARRPLPESSLRELASWPTEGRWTAREDLAVGQNAGILTSPQLVYNQLDRRQRMTALYDVLWCSEASSVGATPASLLSITGANLQLSSDGWKDLAARPICTGCHARLDYGFQFFWGFPNANVEAYFDPTLQKSGRGPLYVNDIDDKRGEAELNPKGFAHLAVAQPEFRHCMARDFGEYVLGNASTPDKVASLERSMRSNTTAGYDLMKQAMLLLIEDWENQHPVVAAAPQRDLRSGSTAGSAVAIDEQRRQLLEHACLDCHEHEAGRPDFATPNVERKTVVAMLEAVAAGSMPKDNPLGADERRAFLETFIDSIWSGNDAAAARRYFIAGDSIPVYRPEVALALIHQRARSNTPSSWRMVENAVRPSVQQLTPGFAAITGLEAIEACKRISAQDERTRCISDAIRLDQMTSRVPQRSGSQP